MTTQRPVRAAPHAGQLDVVVVAPQDLGEAELAAWRLLQQQDTALDNPFLCPEFVLATAQLRPGVRIAVVRQGSKIVAFFPFERHGDVGRPVAGGLSDCQAVLAEPGWDWDSRALVRAAGLSVFEFTFFRAAQRPFAPHHTRHATSLVINMTTGFENYVRERREAGTHLLHASSGLPHQIMARARRLERQVGPLRFEMHDPDPRTLRLLIDWKRQQYRRTGAPDVFARRWTTDLLERIHVVQTSHFAGVLSTLSAGGRIIAAHMGMRSATVLNYWFPAYDRTYAKHSPGLVLLLGMCRATAGHSIQRIDLGPWSEAYKFLLANEGIPVASGFVVGSPSLSAACHRLRHVTERTAASMPIGRFAGWPGKLFQRLDMIRLLR